MKKNVFCKLAENYFSVHKKSLSIFSNMDLNYFVSHKINIVKENISISPKNILDFGCGIGLSTKYLSDIFPESKIVGIDTSAKSIEIAKNMNISNAKFFHYDILEEKLMFNKFDIIFVSCVFQHIMPEMRQKILEKLCAMLNKNGKLFIFEHNPYNPITSFIYHKTEIDNGCSMISSFELNRILNKIDIENIKILPTYYTIFIPRYTFFSKLFFIDKYLKNIPIGGQYYKIIQKL